MDASLCRSSSPASKCVDGKMTTCWWKHSGLVNDFARYGHLPDILCPEIHCAEITPS